MTERDLRPTRFRRPDDQEELARLKRLTGLDFSEVPCSLLDPQRPDDDPGHPASPLPAPRLNVPRG